MDSFVRHTEAAASETLSEKSAIALESTKAAIKAGVAATRDLRNTIRSTRDCIARSAVTASASDRIMNRWWYKQGSAVEPAGDIASEQLALFPFQINCLQDVGLDTPAILKESKRERDEPR